MDPKSSAQTWSDPVLNASLCWGRAWRGRHLLGLPAINSVLVWKMLQFLFCPLIVKPSATEHRIFCMTVPVLNTYRWSLLCVCYKTIWYQCDFMMHILIGDIRLGTCLIQKSTHQCNTYSSKCQQHNQITHLISIVLHRFILTESESIIKSYKTNTDSDDKFFWLLSQYKAGGYVSDSFNNTLATAYTVVNTDLEVRSCGHEILLYHRNNTAMLRWNGLHHLVGQGIHNDAVWN